MHACVGERESEGDAERGGGGWFRIEGLAFSFRWEEVGKVQNMNTLSEQTTKTTAGTRAYSRHALASRTY